MLCLTGSLDPPPLCWMHPATSVLPVCESSASSSGAPTIQHPRMHQLNNMIRGFLSTAAAAAALFRMNVTIVACPWCVERGSGRVNKQPCLCPNQLLLLPACEHVNMPWQLLLCGVTAVAVALAQELSRALPSDSLLLSCCVVAGSRVVACCDLHLHVCP